MWNTETNPASSVAGDGSRQHSQSRRSHISNTDEHSQLESERSRKLHITGKFVKSQEMHAHAIPKSQFDQPEGPLTAVVTNSEQDTNPLACKVLHAQHSSQPGMMEITYPDCTEWSMDTNPAYNVVTPRSDQHRNQSGIMQITSPDQCSEAEWKIDTNPAYSIHVFS